MSATTNQPRYQKPFLKWAGGKTKLLPELIRRMPREYGTYHELFLGGGALFFAVQPKKAVLSDSNLRLIRTYHGVRDHVEEVIDLLQQYKNTEEEFKGAKEREIDTETDAAVAAWFIYLNKTCFNGLYRVNKKNRFNVPFGKNKNPNICDVDTLRACSKILQGVDILYKSYIIPLYYAQSVDFVYCDPPYAPINASASFTQYTASGFGEKDQKALMGQVRLAKLRGVSVMVSNSTSPFIRHLYSTNNFLIEEVEVSRAMRSRASGSEVMKAKELIIR